MFLAYILLGIAIGIIAGMYLRTLQSKILERRTSRCAQEILEVAQKEAENLKKETLLAAKEEILKEKQSLEEDIQRKRRELQNFESRLLRREENLERKMEQLEKKENQLNELLKETEKIKQETEKLKEKEIQELHRIANLSWEEARQEVLSRVEKTLEHEIGLKVKEAEEQVKKESERIAREVVVQAIQRYAADFTAENTVSVVTLPNDEMKGRIIGREGRN
ncbi:MAG: DUF3552 domain-containing protein, partial [Candidatus Atribacteria bacterium]|nr:DUF3552 domain-containing protein [Candidatus Atribacteria bacterium]MCD6349929.1 DUF3552 domain-containing protein [Candidatus Atribacteria bacterium]